MTLSLAVLVPVMRRPQNAATFMRAFEDSEHGSSTVYAVCDSDDVDTKEKWIENRAQVIERPSANCPGTFAEKVNYAFGRTSEDWILLLGDDARFIPGWYEEVIRVIEKTNACVVGTNDLCNPRVMSGLAITQPVISRSYVKTLGASWDGPGIVCHEGYRHNFVDTEIYEVAKERNVVAFALQAVIEHFHPDCGKNSSDSVYALGTSFASVDRELFASRKRKYLEG